MSNSEQIEQGKKISEAKTALSEMGDKKVGIELYHILHSRHKLVYIVTPEEKRVMRCLKHIANAYKYRLHQWDLVKGLIDCQTGSQVGGQLKDQESEEDCSLNEIHTKPHAAIAHILEECRSLNKKLKEQEKVEHNGQITAFFDMHHFLNPNFPSPYYPEIERTLKEIESVPSTASVIIIGNSFVCPDSLKHHFTVIDFPYPSEQEIDKAIEGIIKAGAINYPNLSIDYKNKRDGILSSVKGLTQVEAENALAKSAVAKKSFDVRYIMDEKKQVIRKTGILEYIQPKYSFDDIGGLEVLKNWLKLRKNGFTQEARNFGIDTPKGILMIGVPGTGKTISCSAASMLYEFPFLRMDIGSLFGSLLGESESRTRQSLKIAESIAPCILQIDEIDKGISGSASSGQTDGGVTSRVLGTLLTWLSEKTAPVFVMATANNHNAIPVEFLRAGRFDEIFFVDLPGMKQRKEVISCLLKRKNRLSPNIDLEKLAEESQNYSPAELEKAINNTLFELFESKKNLTTELILKNIKSFHPLYNTRKDEIEQMRSWALGKDGLGGRAMLASEPDLIMPIGSKKFDISNEEESSRFLDD